MKLTELAQKIDAELLGDGAVEIVRASGIEDAAEGSLTFITDARQWPALERSGASAAVVPLSISGAMPLLRVRNPKLAFAKAIALLHPESQRQLGIHQHAAIAESATIGLDPSIGPFVAIAENVRIGQRVTLHPGVSIAEGCIIGDDVTIHANVAIYRNTHIGDRVIIHAGTVIGKDGFGYVFDEGRHCKVPQVGTVKIENDVEIGGNCTIDRASLGTTVIRQGTKLDNQVHIAHNVTIGEHCVIAGQSGIAGSTTLGNYAMLGGHVAIRDHVTIGDRVMMGGAAIVNNDIEAGQVIAGYYAMPLKEWLRVQAILPKLPLMRKQIVELERQMKQLQEKQTK